MAEKEIDLVDQIFGGDESASPPALSRGTASGPTDVIQSTASGTLTTAAAYAGPIETATDAGESSLADSPAGLGELRRRIRRPHFRVPLALPRRGSRAGRRAMPSWLRTAAGLASAFTLGALAILAIGAIAVLLINNACTNRVAPGVHIGALDLSGLTRDEAVAEIETAYAYLGEGQIVITTPTGTATMTYQQISRGPDAEFMADQAMRIGHTGNPLQDAVNIARSGLSGQAIPLAVSLDPMAVATGVRQVEDTHEILPANAGVTVQDGIVSVSPAIHGSRINEVAISDAIVAGLAETNATSQFKVGEAFVTLVPRIDDADAQNAIAAFQRMVVNVHLHWSDPLASPTPSTTATVSPSPSVSSAPGKDFTIEAGSVSHWISIGTRSDGSYGPIVDPTPVQTAIAAVTSKLAVAPVEPHVVFDTSGKPADITGGKDGVGVDVAATADAVVAYLDYLSEGYSADSTIEILTAPIHPKITIESLAGMTMIGSWTTTFYPGITNGNGVNIRLPATLLNGQVVQAGAQFNFLQAVGPIDKAHGYTLGGVIKNGKSDHTGAMGGGICSASTTMFNAAARAGLRIDERHAHAYYIDRYPVGLDATVFSNGVSVYNLKWTNDTPNPIVIRSYTTGRARSQMTVQLWSLPTGRKVTFSPQFKANVVKASDHTVYVTSLKPGQQNRAEYPTAGFDTSRTRTVTDADGKVIHLDTWVSHYVKVDGLLEIGAPLSTPTPTPAPSSS
jgi:vancomycin resistance protein YoaR